MCAHHIQFGDIQSKRYIETCTFMYIHLSYRSDGFLKIFFIKKCKWRKQVDVLNFTITWNEHVLTQYTIVHSFDKNCIICNSVYNCSMNQTLDILKTQTSQKFSVSPPNFEITRLYCVHPLILLYSCYCCLTFIN